MQSEPLLFCKVSFSRNNNKCAVSWEILQYPLFEFHFDSFLLLRRQCFVSKMTSKSFCEDDSPSRVREKSKIANWFSLPSSASSSRTQVSPVPVKSPPKNDRNVFQRMMRKFEKRFPRNRSKPGNSSSEAWTLATAPVAGSSSMDAAAVIAKSDSDEDMVDMDSSMRSDIFAGLADEYVPMEGDKRRHLLRKKWMEGESPNVVMYRACMEMLGHAWYWGEISRHEAQRQLTDKPNGSFLIRDSEKNGSQFTLSFRMWNRTLHYRLQNHDNYWHFELRKYESIVEMVEHFMNLSDNEMFFVQRTSDIMPPFPVVLRYPISRYLKFTTLQDLCRRVIQRSMCKENIDMLPIPVQLKEYLNEKDTSGMH